MESAAVTISSDNLDVYIREGKRFNWVNGYFLLKVMPSASIKGWQANKDTMLGKPFVVPVVVC